MRCSNGAIRPAILRRQTQLGARVRVYSNWNYSGGRAMLKKGNALIWALLLAPAFASASHTLCGAPPALEAPSPQGEGILLGQSHVDSRHDHDNIKVGRVDGTFRGIQLQVAGGPVEFDHVVVHFGNGSSEPIPVRYRIEDGGSTRLIELPGARRVIRSVELWYSKGAWEGRPTVTLFGFR
jgi:hypothetical protein